MSEQALEVSRLPGNAAYQPVLSAGEQSRLLGFLRHCAWEQACKTCQMISVMARFVLLYLHNLASSLPRCKVLPLRLATSEDSPQSVSLNKPASLSASWCILWDGSFSGTNLGTTGTQSSQDSFRHLVGTRFLTALLSAGSVNFLFYFKK